MLSLPELEDTKLVHRFYTKFRLLSSGLGFFESTNVIGGYQEELTFNMLKKREEQRFDFIILPFLQLYLLPAQHF